MNLCRFGPELWNKRDAALESSALSTNCAEGYNRALHSMVPLDSNLWITLNQLQKESLAVEVKLRDSILQPSQPTTSRASSIQSRAAKLKTLCERYDATPLNDWLRIATEFFNYPLVN